jgi:ABC-type cobalt transport system substrate-binding protein
MENNIQNKSNKNNANTFYKRNPILFLMLIVTVLLLILFIFFFNRKNHFYNINKNNIHKIYLVTHPNYTPFIIIKIYNNTSSICRTKYFGIKVNAIKFR